MAEVQLTDMWLRRFQRKHIPGFPLIEPQIAYFNGGMTVNRKEKKELQKKTKAELISIIQEWMINDEKQKDNYARLEERYEISQEKHETKNKEKNKKIDVLREEIESLKNTIIRKDEELANERNSKEEYDRQHQREREHMTFKLERFARSADTLKESYKKLIDDIGVCESDWNARNWS